MDHVITRLREFQNAPGAHPSGVKIASWAIGALEALQSSASQAKQVESILELIQQLDARLITTEKMIHQQNNIIAELTDDQGHSRPPSLSRQLMDGEV